MEPIQFVGGHVKTDRIIRDDSGPVVGRSSDTCETISRGSPKFFPHSLSNSFKNRSETRKRR